MKSNRSALSGKRLLSYFFQSRLLAARNEKGKALTLSECRTVWAGAVAAVTNRLLTSFGGQETTCDITTMGDQLITHEHTAFPTTNRGYNMHAVDDLIKFDSEHDSLDRMAAIEMYDKLVGDDTGRAKLLAALLDIACDIEVQYAVNNMYN